MKKILFLLAMVGLLTSGVSSARLYDYYAEKGQNLPSVESRVSLAEQCGIQNYQGLAEQNIALEACLRGNVGASLPVVVALYEDSLASRLSSTATSTFTLVRGTDKQSRNLNGYYNFVIDEGTTVEEFFLATCSGTACTINTRGIDVVDGKTGTTSLQFEHRRGAVVKITNFPQLAILSRILQGLETTPGGLTFATNTFYVSSTLFGIRQNGLQLQWTTDGFVNSYNFTSSSISQLTASSTAGIGVLNSEIYVLVSSTLGMAFGPDGRLYQKTSSTSGLASDVNGIYINTTTLSQANWATTTPTGNQVPIADNGGFIDSNWVSSESYFGSGVDGAGKILSGTTTLSSDKYYTSLTVNSGAVLITNGYKVYDSGTLLNNGTIQNNGISATSTPTTVAGGGGVGGLGGGQGTLHGGAKGGNGGVGTDSGGNAGTSGAVGVSTTSIPNVNGVAGGDGGIGGVGGGGPGFGGAAGTATIESALFISPTAITSTVLSLNATSTINKIYVVVGTTSLSFLSGSAGSGGGGGGASGNAGESGNGGGAGGNGGVVLIVAYKIINNGTISSNGGNGANGDDAVSGGGGGGGGGGQGGLVVLVYKTYSGTLPTVTGGTGGTKGALGGTGGAATDGTNGNAGKYILVDIN